MSFTWLFNINHNGWCMFAERISESVHVREDKELRNEPRSLGAQLAYHRTPTCNMYFVNGRFYSCFVNMYLSM